MALPTPNSPVGAGLSHAAMHNFVVDVKGHFNAAGDGSTDDTAAIQSAIDAAPDGATIWFSRTSSYYKLTDDLTVTKPLTFAGPGDIRQTVAGKALFTVTGELSGVHFRGLTLTGPQAASFNASEKCITAVGTDADNPISGFSVVGCKIRTFGYGAVHLKWVNDFLIDGNDIQDMGFIGVQLLSCLRGSISDNTIVDMAPGTAGNAYGIHLTRAETSSISTDPQSADIAVTGNTIKDVPLWTGIDTHGGLRITIAGNTVLNCKTGIAVGSADNGSGTPTWAPRDVSVVGNTIESNKTDGTAGAGISFNGAAGSVGTPNETGSGSIVGNTIKNHGTSSSNLAGGIEVRDTESLVISGNHIWQPSPSGVVIYHDNYGFSCVGNTVIDPWSNTGGVGAAWGVRVASTHNNGTISGNSWRLGALAGKTFKMTRGIGVEGATNNSVTIGPNRSDASAFHILDSNSQSTAQAYTVTNHVTDRSYNANATSTDELADILGTLIADLRSMGVVR